MLLRPSPLSSNSSAGRPALDVALSLRSRGLAGAAAIVIALVGVGIAGIPFQGPAWIALGAALVSFGGVAWRPIARLFDRAGGAVATVIGTLLVLGTGGVDSPFQDMYAIILVYSAVVMTWRRLAFDTSVVAGAVALTGILGAATSDYYADGLIDLSVWVTIAVLAGGLSRQLSATTRRQRSDAAFVDAADTAMITTDDRGIVTGVEPRGGRSVRDADGGRPRTPRRRRRQLDAGRPVAGTDGPTRPDPVQHPAP